MKRWRKTTRVNGVTVYTLRLHNTARTGDIRGVILSLEVMHEKHGRTLVIELDGESPLTVADETEALHEAGRLLQEAIDLLKLPEK